MAFEANSQERESLQKLRSAGKTIVFTNGCFDILHVGHLRYLTEAKGLGDTLIVGINSDESVRRLKGSPRPYVNENERKELLLGLKPVDEVFIFSDDTPYDLICAVQPDVLVKGGDWPIDKIVGADVVQAKGGKVFSLKFTAGKSTTNLLDLIRK